MTALKICGITLVDQAQQIAQFGAHIVTGKQIGRAHV